MVDIIEKLHTAARSYCIENHAYWTYLYNEITENGTDREQNGRNYSIEAKNIFPRYNVLDAILIEVEKFVPADFDTIEEAKELLKEVGETANTIFTQNCCDIIISAVMSDEREKFKRYISNISFEDISNIHPLFYRRTLTMNESKMLRSELKRIWQVGDDFWSLIKHSPIEAITFQAELFESEFGYESLQRIISIHGVKRIWELREYGAEYEIDLTIFEPSYNGAEGFWFSEERDWFIFASHEDSITIGGTWLIEQVKCVWENWCQRIWATNS